MTNPLIVTKLWPLLFVVNFLTSIVIILVGDAEPQIYFCRIILHHECTIMSPMLKIYSMLKSYFSSLPPSPSSSSIDWQTITLSPFWGGCKCTILGSR